MFTVLLVVHSFLWVPWHGLFFFLLFFKPALTVTAPLWVFYLTFDLWWPPSQFSSTCIPRLRFCVWKNKSTNMSCDCSPLCDPPQCHHRLIVTRHWIGTHSLSKCTGSPTQKPRCEPVSLASEANAVWKGGWRWGEVIFLWSAGRFYI